MTEVLDPATPSTTGGLPREVVTYAPSSEVWAGYDQLIRDRIDSQNARRVCDIGGGANPVIGQDFIRDRGLDYWMLDISGEELDKAPPEYGKIVADAASPDFQTDERFDLIFSKMLVEHIPDARQFHTNVLSMLRPGGLAIHFFPTLYTVPFTINRLFPERLSSRLLDLFHPRDRFQHDKFPAYYQWCRGPSEKQLARFTDLGYEVVEYRGYFGHPNYYRRIKPLQMLHRAKTARLLKNPNPTFTSFAVMILRKPAGG